MVGHSKSVAITYKQMLRSATRREHQDRPPHDYQLSNIENDAGAPFVGRLLNSQLMICDSFDLTSGRAAARVEKFPVQDHVKLWAVFLHGGVAPDETVGRKKL